MNEIEFNYTLVALSYVIAVCGSYAGLNIAIKIPSAKPGANLISSLMMSSIAIGAVAIWSMHYIGMMAVNMHVPVSYDLGLTIVSMIFAIFACAIGLFIVGRGTPSVIKLLTGGVITGLGVCAMHYTGMASMIMPGTVIYDTTLVILSVIIAIIAAIAALWFAFNLRGNFQRIGSALVMGIAVCGMHYTGMLAMKMSHVGEVAHADNIALNQSEYTYSAYIFVGGLIVVGIMLFISSMGTSKNDGLVFDD